MNYAQLRSAPLEALLATEIDPEQTPQERLKANEALHARVHEINGEGWAALDTYTRQAVLDFFDREAEHEEEAT